MQSGITCKTSKPKLRVGDERALSKGEDGSHKQPRCGKWSHMPKPAKVRREDELSEQLKTRRWLPRTATTQVECCRGDPFVTTSRTPLVEVCTVMHPLDSPDIYPVMCKQAVGHIGHASDMPNQDWSPSKNNKEKTTQKHTKHKIGKSRTVRRNPYI